MRTPVLLTAALPYTTETAASALACTCQGLRVACSKGKLLPVGAWPQRVLTVGDGNLTFSLGLQRALAALVAASAPLHRSCSSSAPSSFTASIPFQLSPALPSSLPATSSESSASSFPGTVSSAAPRPPLPSLIRIVATTFDSEASLFEKYPEAGPAKRKLLQLGVSVLHGVNAISLPRMGSFSAIVFNHPHLGVEDAAMHRILLAHFLYTCRKHLRPGGRVYVSLIEGQPERWRLLQEAQRAGYSLMSATHMNPEDFPGYEIRRTHSGRSFVSAAAKRQSNFSQTSRMFCFGRCEESCSSGISIVTSSASSTHAAGFQRAEGLRVHPANNAKRRKRKRNNELQASLSFQCKHCERAFSTAQGLRTHTRQVHVLKLYDSHNGGRSKAKCFVCDRVFASDDALGNHVRAKHGKDQAIPAHWKMHSSQMHSSQQAGGASSRDATTSALARNSSASTSAPAGPAALTCNSSTPVRCNICNCIYPDQDSYRKHYVSLQPIVKKLPHPCPGCHKIFGDTRALRQHMNFCSGVQ